MPPKGRLSAILLGFLPGRFLWLLRRIETVWIIIKVIVVVIIIAVGISVIIRDRRIIGKLSEAESFTTI